MLDSWVSPWWQAAALPESWNVCGVIVPPLTIWHMFALEHVGNRFVCGGEPGRDDAASLLLFASHNYRQGCSLLWKDNERNKCIRRLHKQLVRMTDAEILPACTQYVQACTRVPRRWKKSEGGGKSASVPYQWHLLSMLTKSLPMAEAWNQPYAAARCLYDAQAEQNGDDSIMAPQHEAMDDRMFEEDKKMGATPSWVR